MIAEINPDIGGAPDATAIPKPKGMATKETLIAAKKSERQFSFRPFHPTDGAV